VDIQYLAVGPVIHVCLHSLAFWSLNFKCFETKK
jgi:hypothetical protein